jgi:hypothetical protein
MMLEKLKNLIFPVVVLGFGIAMLMNPHSMDGAEATGRRSFLKMILIKIWGMPAGIILTLLGLGLAYAVFKSDGTDEEAS